MMAFPQTLLSGYALVAMQHTLRYRCPLASLCVPALLALFGCSGDHSLLAVDPESTSASSAGTSGTGGSGGEGGAAGGGGAGGAAPIEPAGPTRLTVVNGVVDYNAVRICFLSYPDSGQPAAPWPADAAGLPFGASRTIDLAGSVIPKNTDVRLHVIGGDLQAIAGKSCAEAIAMAQGGGGTGGAGGGSTSPIAVAALPVIAAPVFASPKSLLLVPHGCLGGPAHSDPAEVAVCGPGYSPATPTVSLVAGGMSRITVPEAISLQIVHASAAMPVVDVKITPGDGTGAEKQVASKLSLGAIAPFPPFSALSLADYGSLAQVKFQTYTAGTTMATSSVLLKDVFATSTIGSSEFANGEGFVLVAVGAGPGTAAGPWWHTFSYALIRADP